MDDIEAVELAKQMAANYNPSYFTSLESFEPHAWVVAAIKAAYGKGYDFGWQEHRNFGFQEDIELTMGD